MIVEVKFNLDLDKEEDKEKFEQLTQDKGGKLQCAMHTFANDTLRKYRKYGGLIEAVQQELVMGPTPSTDDMGNAIISHIEKKFYEALEEYEATIE